MPMQRPVMPPPPGLGAAPPPAPAAPPLPDFTSFRDPALVPNPGRGAPSFPAPFDPSSLPQGATMYEDGSVTLSPEAARAIFANQAGGPSGMPPGPPPLPPEMAAAMPLMSGLGANPMGATPPPVPAFGGQMPGQPPTPPTDPAGALMFEMQQRNAPVEPPRPPLSAPPSATPPPRDQWPVHLQQNGGAAEPSKAPMDRLRNRGGGSTPRKRG